MRYVIFDNYRAEIIRSFSNKKDCRDWVMSGMFSCEGAEREHYVNMLGQLENGKKTLSYWED